VQAMATIVDDWENSSFYSSLELRDTPCEDEDNESLPFKQRFMNRTLTHEDVNVERVAMSDPNFVNEGEG